MRTHKAVLLDDFIELVKPIRGCWIDCTFGAGGYSKALLEAGAQKIIGLDRDPSASVHVRKLKATHGTTLPSPMVTNSRNLSESLNYLLSN